MVVSKKSMVIMPFKELMKDKKYWDKWLCTETLLNEFLGAYPEFIQIGISTNTLSKAIYSEFGMAMEDYCSSTSTGLFRHMATSIYPYQQVRKKLVYYCITKAGELPCSGRPKIGDFPGLSSDHVFMRSETRSEKIKRMREETDKDKREEVLEEMTMYYKVANISSKITSEICSPYLEKHSVLTTCGDNMSYWNSKDAHTLFNVADDENVIDILENRIKVLRVVNQSPAAYKDIVRGHDKENKSSLHEIMVLQQKSVYLCLSYVYALQNMNTWKWIGDCCKIASNDLKVIGYKLGTNPNTIAVWNKEFRVNGLFNHPNPHISLGKVPIPECFNIFPEAKDMMLAHFKKNMADLTIDRLHSYVCSTLIPELQSKESSTTEHRFSHTPSILDTFSRNVRMELWSNHHFHTRFFSH